MVARAWTNNDVRRHRISRRLATSRRSQFLGAERTPFGAPGAFLERTRSKRRRHVVRRLRRGLSRRAPRPGGGRRASSRSRLAWCATPRRAPDGHHRGGCLRGRRRDRGRVDRREHRSVRRGRGRRRPARGRAGAPRRRAHAHAEGGGLPLHGSRAARRRAARRRDPAAAAGVDASAWTLEGAATTRVVLVDGVFCAALSDLSGVPGAVVAGAASAGAAPSDALGAVVGPAAASSWT